MTDPTLIPPDTYDGVCVSQKVYKQYKGLKKLCLEWEVELMNGNTVKLPQHFNLKYTSFKNTTKYYTAFVIANESRKPTRRTLNYMSPKLFLGLKAVLQIKTTIPRFDNGTDKPEVFHYSIVSEVLEFIERIEIDSLHSK